jgi:hypothetical protein
VIHFFRKGGGMDEWIEAARFELSGDQVRRKLGIA